MSLLWLCHHRKSATNTSGQALEGERTVGGGQPTVRPEASLAMGRERRHHRRRASKGRQLVRCWSGLLSQLFRRRLRGCLGLLHKLCSTNSTVEQLHKKLEFVEYLFRCSHNSTLFPRTESVELKPFGSKTWSEAEKREAEFVEQSQTHNKSLFGRALADSSSNIV